MLRFVSGLVAVMFFVSSVVTVDMRYVGAPIQKQEMLAPASTGVVSLDSVLNTLASIAEGEALLDASFDAALQALPSLELNRKAVFALNALLLQPMPGASEQEYVDAKSKIIEAMLQINDGFALTALITFRHLIQKKQNPELRPLSPGYSSELVWGMGKKTGALVKELLDEVPVLSEENAKLLAAGAKEAWSQLHSESYLPHWSEHVFPANHLRMLQKSYLDQAPYLLRDLEDAVALSLKVQGRITLAKIQAEGEFSAKKDRLDPDAPMRLHPGNRWVALRPNNLGTSFSAADFVWLRDNLLIEDYDYPSQKRLAFDGVVIPKAMDPEEVRIVSRILRLIEDKNDVARGTMKMGYLIEDPTSAIATYGFASADETVVAGNYGVADWTASTGGRPAAQEKYNAALWARKRTAVGFHAAKSAHNPRGVDAIEAISVPLTEKDSKRESRQARQAGMDGKWSVHPNHIKGIIQEGWPFHESRMTRKPLGDWTDFKPYDEAELERRAAEGIPLVDREPAIAKAVQPQRASIIINAKDLEQIEQALQLPLDQITLNISGSENLDALAVLLEKYKTTNKSRLAFLLDASSLDQDALEKFGASWDLFAGKVVFSGLTLDNVTSPDQIRQVDAFLKSRLEKDPTIRPELFQVQARITSKEMIDHSLLEGRDVDFYDDAWQAADVQWASAPETWTHKTADRLFQISRASDYVGTLVFAVPGLANDPVAKGHLLSAAKAAEVEVVDASVVEGDNWLLIAEQMAEIGYRGQEIPSLDRLEGALKQYSPSPALINRSLDVTFQYDMADVFGGLGAIAYARPDGATEIVDEATAKIDRGVVEVAAVADLFSPDQRSQYLRLLAVLHNTRVPFPINEEEIQVLENANVSDQFEALKAKLSAQDLPVIKITAEALGSNYEERLAGLKAISQLAVQSKSKTGRYPLVLVEGSADIHLGLMADELEPEIKSQVVGITRTEKEVFVSFTHATSYEVAKATVLWLKSEEQGYNKNTIRIFTDREAYVNQLSSENASQVQLAVEQLIAHARDIRNSLEGQQGNIYGLSGKEATYKDNVPFLSSSMPVQVAVSEKMLGQIKDKLGFAGAAEDMLGRLAGAFGAALDPNRLTLHSEKDGSTLVIVASEKQGILGYDMHTTVYTMGEAILSEFDSKLPDGRVIDVGLVKKRSLAVGDKFQLVDSRFTYQDGNQISTKPTPRTISDPSIRGYAGFSEDRNLHHLNEEWAKTNLGSRIAHGMLTSSLGLDRLGAILGTFSKGYSVIREESSYKAKVPLNDALSFTAEVVSKDSEGNLKVVITAFNKRGKPVSGNVIWLSVGEKVEPSELVQQVKALQRGELKEDASRETYMAETFGNVGPFLERPAPRFSVGDEMEYAWVVSEEKIKAYASLFEGNEWADLLIGKAVSAKASSSMAPGSILLGSRVLKIVRPIPVGDTLKIKATIVNLRKSSKGADILTEHVQIFDSNGNFLLHAQVTKQVQSAYEEKQRETSLRPTPVSEEEQGLPLTPQTFDVEALINGPAADLSAKPWVAERGEGVSETIEVTGTNIVEELISRINQSATKDEANLEFVTGTGERSSQSAAQLAKDVKAFALVLQNKFGVRKGDRIALMLANGYESRVSLLASIYIGAVAVPLDVLYQESELTSRFEDAEPRIVIADVKHNELLESISRSVGGVDDLIFVDERDYFRTPDEDENAPNVSSFKTALATKVAAQIQPVKFRKDGLDVAILQYKSGAELGKVRGIKLTHRNLLAAVARRAEVTFAGTEKAKLVYASPEYHSWGYITGVLLPLWAGQGSVTIADQKRESQVPFVDLLFQELTEGTGTHFFGVPSVFARLRDRMVKEQKVASPTFSTFVSAAAPLTEELRLSFQALTQGNLVQAYGQKEATVPVHAPVDRPLKPGSVGLPGQGVELILVDAENQDGLSPIGLGEKVGEIALLADPEVVALGVWNDVEATRDLAQKYQGRYYRRTGDIGFVDEQGYVYILSRLDDVMIVSGNNVYPAEIESVLEQHSEVEASIVVGLDDPKKGEVPVAYVQLKKADSLDEEVVRQYVAKKLAGYKVPKNVVFVSELPWKVAGAKKDRAKMRAVLKETSNFAGAQEAVPVAAIAQPKQTIEELTKGADVSLVVVTGLVDQVSVYLANKFSVDGRIKNDLIDGDQKAAEEYALMISYLETAMTMFSFLNTRTDLTEIDKQLSIGYLGEALNRIRQLLLDKPEAYGLNAKEVWEAFNSKPVGRFFAGVNSHEWLEEVGEALLKSNIVPSYLLDPENEEGEAIAAALSEFADDKIRPNAERIHRTDELVSEDIIGGLGEMGAFGMSIPEAYGGFQENHDNIGMILATIELSDASLGAAGSLITRPEITSKVILRGGTEEQKETLLPGIAAGEKMVTVLFTEPNYGSDLANIKMTAELDEETNEWVLNGTKMWGTFAGRADYGLVLVRTKKDESGQLIKGHAGLSTILFDKPAVRDEWTDEELPEGVRKDGESYKFTQETGGELAWKQDHTTGYRGMHSYTLFFDDFRVPADRLIGEEGQGFFLVAKEGLAGGRVQTAARSIGLMRAAYREAVNFANERKLFPTKANPGRVEADFGLTKVSVAKMAMLIHGAQQYTFRAAKLVTEGDIARDQGDKRGANKGRTEASLAKLVFSRFANEVTRKAQQLHGGLGVAEEYPVARYAVDAQVLTIFEGAEEILALRIVAPTFLRARLKTLLRELEARKQAEQEVAVAI